MLSLLNDIHFRRKKLIVVISVTRFQLNDLFFLNKKFICCSLCLNKFNISIEWSICFEEEIYLLLSLLKFKILILHLKIFGFSLLFFGLLILLHCLFRFKKRINYIGVRFFFSFPSFSFTFLVAVLLSYAYLISG